jgi:hypothetical protein
VDAGGNVTTANTQAVTAKFIAAWTQIATHFKSYDNRVVFESMNEVGHNPVTAAVYGVCNGLNQTFVTTVRGTGGNNASRFLDVPGHYTNIDNTVAGFVLPTDTIPNHLILTYHYYDPYSFTLAGTTHEWGAAYPGSDNSGQESWVVSEFDKMRRPYEQHRHIPRHHERLDQGRDEQLHARPGRTSSVTLTRCRRRGKEVEAASNRRRRAHGASTERFRPAGLIR